MQQVILREESVVQRVLKGVIGVIEIDLAMSAHL
jgi:hypothetical protein